MHYFAFIEPKESQAHKGVAVSASDEKIMRALGRILRTWSLIKFVPMRSILPLQAPLLRLLSARPDLSEDQLVALGIKHLYSSRNISKRGKPVSAALDAVNALRGASKIVEVRPEKEITSSQPSASKCDFPLSERHRRSYRNR